MKTLKEIATPGEIRYLLDANLITADYIDREPEEVREVSDTETEIEYTDGLVVTIYLHDVEPQAEWK